MIAVVKFPFRFVHGSIKVSIVASGKIQPLRTTLVMKRADVDNFGTLVSFQIGAETAKKNSGKEHLFKSHDEILAKYVLNKEQVQYYKDHAEYVMESSADKGRGLSCKLLVQGRMLSVDGSYTTLFPVQTMEVGE